MARYYDACNHVLHTLLMKLSSLVFGTGELALRIPSLIGALLYFTAVYRLTLLLFRGWPQLLAVGAMVLHPMVLDFMVAARGYGLALALFTWSFYFAVSWLIKGFDRRLLWRSGVCGGLAIAANLTLAVPVISMGLLLCLLALHRGRSSLREIADGWAGPAFVPAFLLLLFPAMAVTGIEFYYGASSFPDFVRSVVESIGKVPGSAVFVAVRKASLVLVPLGIALFAGISVAAAMLLGRQLRSGRMDYRTAPYLLAAGIPAASALILIAGHYLARVPYPFGRTGLYMIPLVTLAILFGARLLPRGRNAVWAAVLLLVIVYANQIEIRHFGFWRYDASTKALLRHLQDDHFYRTPDKPVTLAATDILETTIEYYKHRRPVTWLNGPVTENIDTAPADYYLLTERDEALATKLNLEILKRDPLSGTILARSPQ